MTSRKNSVVKRDDPHKELLIKDTIIDWVSNTVVFRQKGDTVLRKEMRKTRVSMKKRLVYSSSGSLQNVSDGRVRDLLLQE